MQFIASCTKGALRTTRSLKLIWTWISSQIFSKVQMTQQEEWASGDQGEFPAAV